MTATTTLDLEAIETLLNQVTHLGPWPRNTIIALVAEVRRLRRSVAKAKAERDAEWIAEFHCHFEGVQSVAALRKVFADWEGRGVIAAHVHEIWKRDPKVQTLEAERDQLRAAQEDSDTRARLAELNDLLSGFDKWKPEGVSVVKTFLQNRIHRYERALAQTSEPAPLCDSLINIDDLGYSCVLKPGHEGAHHSRSGKFSWGVDPGEPAPREPGGAQ